jgi:hypoxanthine-guanine phosphoribosyltransferase
MFVPKLLCALKNENTFLMGMGIEKNHTIKNVPSIDLGIEEYIHK